MPSTPSIALLSGFLLVACSDAQTADPARDSGAVDAGGDATAPDADATPDASAPPGLALLDFHLAVDVTPDGRTAAFETLTSTEARLVYYDTVTGTGVDATSVGDPSRDLATGISAAGRVSALHGVPVRAGVFTQTGGWTDVPSSFSAGCDQDVGGAFDVSAAGDVVVGLDWNGCSPQAFRWVDDGAAGQVTLLALLGESAPGSPNPPVNRATVISDDGAVAAGFAQRGAVDRGPALWRADGTGELLDPSPTDTPGEVLAIDATGDVLAGVRGFEGFVWTRSGGFVDLARFAVALPSDPVFPNAMTADGRVVFGGVGDAFSGVPIAFAWRAASGMEPLQDLASAAGIVFPAGVVLGSVLGASSDGTVLIGTALDGQGMPKTFVLRLPAGTWD